MFSLLYGSGLRKAELLKLRVKDIDFEAKMVFVFNCWCGYSHCAGVTRS
ncbi:MAG: tyrosine-type recombinase/integrase [Glaciecola sp.]